MNLVNLINSIILFLGAIAGTWTSVLYGFRARWWKTGTDEYRRHIGIFTLSLTAVFWLYMIRPLVDPDVFTWVRTPAFGLVVACVIWRLWIMLRSPKHQPEET